MARPRVLIVDEPGERLAFYRSLLDEFGAEAVIAQSGAETLDGMLQEDYALILLNLAGPDSDALDIARRIRRNPRTALTPLLLIGTRPEPVLADLEDPVDCIPAPVTEEVLRSRVRLFLALRRTHVQLLAANSSEQRLRREAENLSRLKDEFLATMSHELRTPLNAIFGWITLLRAGQLDPATAERALETIERNARTQKRLIDDLLDVSRIVSGKVQLEFTEFDPRQVMDSALATMAPAAAARRITVIPELAIGTAALRADFARLQQVVCNLLSNAIKFTPVGGTVHIRMERSPGSLQIAVIDTGQGISAEFLPHVFDRFRQEDGSISWRHSGLGVGLAIVRHLVELHGGTVAAASRGEGQGATFTVLIPAPDLKGESYQPPAVLAAEDLRRLSGLAVLVVDDDAVSREVVANMLQGYGARVTTVDSGQRALTLLMQQPPDVLIADLAMPQMTGIDLIQRIRNLPTEQGGRVPAVAVSAFAAAPDRLLSLQAGFDSHLAKPVESEELARALINTLQQR